MATPLLIAGGFSALVLDHVVYQACYSGNQPAPVDINYTRAGVQSPELPSAQLPGLAYSANVTVTVASASPVALASDTSGNSYALFDNGSGYYLATSSDLLHWKTVGSSVVPYGYGVTPGGDLAITRQGVVIVSATRLADHLNSTIFLASTDGGRDFQTVLNVTLGAKPEAFTALDTGRGGGFWHGVVEASNGYLFAGLYNPQGLVFRSEDGGTSWQLVFNASRGSDWHNEIHDLGINPSNDYVYAVTDDESGTAFNQSIWVTTDLGNDWRMIYSASDGGDGLPAHLAPTTMAFMDGGRVVSLGLEGWYRSEYARSIFLLNAAPDGCIQANARVDASSQGVDPFITWWMQPKDLHSVFVLGHENDPTPRLGVGLYVLSDQGKLSELMTWKGQGSGDWYSVGFIQMAGPCADGSYGVLASADGQVHLLVVRL